jgi:hypothetical protein
MVNVRIQMKTYNPVRSFKTAFRLISMTCFLLAGSQLFSDVILVGSPSISDTNIAASDVEAIFLGKKKSLSSGQKVKIVTLKDGDTHDMFLSSYLNKTASQFSAFWKRKIVDGTGIPPKKFDSESELLAYVRSKDDVIGYVSSGTALDGVKTLSVQ